MNLKFNINAISKYRTELMGLATILILICHAPGNGVTFHPIISRLMAFGNLGVELFLLLSGLGLYYSLESHKSLGEWYRKRYARLLVPYIMIATPLFVCTNISNETGLCGFLIDITTLNWWLYGKWFWFVAMLIPLYAITPVLYRLMSLKRGGVLIISIFTILYITSLIFNGEGVLYHISQVLNRMPCFIIGILIAPYAKLGRKVYIPLLTIVLFAVGAVFYCVNTVIPYWLLIFPIVWLWCVLLKQYPWFSGFLSFWGIISLESYLLNVALPIFRNSADIIPMGIQILIKVVIGTLLAYGVSKISKPVINKLISRRNNERTATSS